MQDRLALDIQAEATSIPPSVSVLTVHGAEDAVVPVQAAHDFARHVATHELHVMQGADHSFTQPRHRAELLDRVVHFVCRS